MKPLVVAPIEHAQQGGLPDASAELPRHRGRGHGSRSSPGEPVTGLPWCC
ncbi:hypothetical protein AB0N28_03115 [Streptomyces sp. NPDC051130]